MCFKSTYISLRRFSTPEMGFYPILVVETLRRASAVFPPLKWDSPHIWGVSHVHGGQKPISLQY